MDFSTRDSAAKLVLKDNQTIEGKLFGYPVSVAGEVVFNTAMTGYPESITDPHTKDRSWCLPIR